MRPRPSATENFILIIGFGCENVEYMIEESEAEIERTLGRGDAGTDTWDAGDDLMCLFDTE